jgi:hypothetical protein
MIMLFSFWYTIKNGRDKSGHLGHPVFIRLALSRLFKTKSGQSGQCMQPRVMPYKWCKKKLCITSDGRNANVGRACAIIVRGEVGNWMPCTPHSAVTELLKMLREVDSLPPPQTGALLIDNVTYRVTIHYD